jgi:isopenicillin-N epimerase
MIGSMASLPLPDGDPATRAFQPDPLQTALFDRYGIEVQISAWPEPPQRTLRISAQLYNTPDEYPALAAALRGLLQR